MAVCDTFPLLPPIPATPQQVNDLEQRSLNNHGYVESIIEREGNPTIKGFYQVLLEAFKRQEESVRFEAFVQTARDAVYNLDAYDRGEERKRVFVANHYEQMANDFFCVASMFSDLRKHNLWKEEDYQSRQAALTKGLAALCSLAWKECAENEGGMSISKLDKMQSVRRQMFINLMELSFPLKP